MAAQDFALKRAGNKAFYDLVETYQALKERCNVASERILGITATRFLVRPAKKELRSLSTECRQIRQAYSSWHNLALSFTLNPIFKIDPAQDRALVHQHHTSNLFRMIDDMRASVADLLLEYHHCQNQIDNQSNFRIAISAAAIATIGLAISLWVKAGKDDSSDGRLHAQSQTIQTVERAVKRGADYLVRIMDKNGEFEYRVNMDPNFKVKQKYNIVRHAGTIYAMSMYDQLFPGDDVKAVMKRAGIYLKNNALRSVLDGKMRAIWSMPKVNHTKDPPQVKLGGTGLGLVALLCIEKFEPEFTPLSDLRALGEFILFMQKEDGSFFSKYIPSRGGMQKNWHSLYYPGEAALGLTMLYEKDPDKRWFDGASKALANLARIRANKKDVPPDHWALIATEKFLALARENELQAPTQLLMEHAMQVCESMLAEQILDPALPHHFGGFTMEGRTTPSSTRLEGLLAALCFLPPDLELRHRIIDAIHKGINFLLRAQITKAPYCGAMPGAVAKIYGNTSQAKRVNRLTTEVRIDYVQHALSAKIKYLELLRSPNP